MSMSSLTWADVASSAAYSISRVNECVKYMCNQQALRIAIFTSPSRTTHVRAVQIDQAAQAAAEKQLADAANEPLPDNDDDELLED